MAGCSSAPVLSAHRFVMRGGPIRLATGTFVVLKDEMEPAPPPVQYVMDNRVGNTDGLGAAFGILAACGEPGG